MTDRIVEKKREHAYFLLIFASFFMYIILTGAKTLYTAEKTTLSELGSFGNLTDLATTMEYYFYTYALMQLVLGGSALSYATSPAAAAAIVVLDYLLAFTVLGFGGIFRKKVPHQGAALVLGAVTTGAMRYALHVIAGCTVWAGLSIPTEAALVYSLAYNATYMVPEILVTALGAWYLSRAVDLREDTLSRAKNAPVKPAAFAVGLAGAAALLVAAVWDVVEIFRPLQDPDTGDFIITNLSLVNWTTVGVVTAVGVTVWGILALIRRRLNRP